MEELLGKYRLTPSFDRFAAYVEQLGVRNKVEEKNRKARFQQHSPPCCSPLRLLQAATGGVGSLIPAMEVVTRYLCGSGSCSAGSSAGGNKGSAWRRGARFWVDEMVAAETQKRVEYATSQAAVQAAMEAAVEKTGNVEQKMRRKNNAAPQWLSGPGEWERTKYFFERGGRILQSSDDAEPEDL